MLYDNFLAGLLFCTVYSDKLRLRDKIRDKIVDVIRNVGLVAFELTFYLEVLL